MECFFFLREPLEGGMVWGLVLMLKVLSCTVRLDEPWYKISLPLPVGRDSADEDSSVSSSPAVTPVEEPPLMVSLEVFGRSFLEGLFPIFMAARSKD